MDALFIWLILMMLFLALGHFLGRRGTITGAKAEEEPQLPNAETLAGFEQKVSPVMAVTGRSSRGGLVQFEGRLRGQPDAALAQLKNIFQPEGLTPLLQEGEHGDMRMLLVPVAAAQPVVEKSNWGLSLL